jgi:SAM-dependent methyltransferase
MTEASEISGRYEGIADYYEARFSHYGDLNDERSSSSDLKRLLGPGSGACLDVACGTGLHFAAIESTGRRVIGLDISSDQLRIARSRASRLVRGSATGLPFKTKAFEAVICTFLHTDIDDMRPVFGEVARVLASGGRFVYQGVHPCFWGANVEFRADEGTRVIHPGYFKASWHYDSPYWGDGLRRRIGQRHATISELINALLSIQSLELQRIHEADTGSGFADRIALVARRR